HRGTSTGFLAPDASSGSAARSEPRKAGPGLPMMPAITEVACWAHCRRSIFDVWQSTKSTVAKAALHRIAQFYAIEDKARFAPARRAAGASRRYHSPAPCVLHLGTDRPAKALGPVGARPG